MQPCRIAPLFLLAAVLSVADPVFGPVTAAETDRQIDVNRDEIAAMEGGEREMDPAALDLLAVPQEVAPTLSPMMQEIRGVLLAEQQELVRLQSELAQTRDAAAALRIQHQIEDLKQETEIEVLSVQVRRARDRGDEDLASQLESSIERILQPPVRKNPVARPAPSDQ